MWPSPDNYVHRYLWLATDCKTSRPFCQVRAVAIPIGDIRSTQSTSCHKSVELTPKHSDSVHLDPRGERENVLFNDALNAFYLRLYGVRHIVKDHSDSEKGNPLPPHRLLLSINIKGYFICTIQQTG